MKKKKTIKRKASKTVKNVPTYSPYGAMHGLTLGALEERIESLEQDIEFLIEMVDMLVVRDKNYDKMPQITTYVPGSP